MEAHLRQVAKTKRIDPDQFVAEKMREHSGAPPEPPYELEWHWRAFQEVSRRRRTGSNGFDPLTFQELDSWQKLCRIELTPFDVDVLCELDDVFLEIINGRLRGTGTPDQESGGGAGHAPPGRP